MTKDDIVHTPTECWWVPMVAIGSLSAMVQAMQLIGIVLVEAIVLYVVYGAAENAFSSAVIDRIKQF
ncbi:Uncharacterized protein HSRCO_1469 [Halanaeroarchaeum sp. HSR-CO]|nr:Uncharacterized protein HSRCO_1469 [Halanaeroarchaeum sp. HSR-CO]